jgi:hypothetical protein
MARNLSKSRFQKGLQCERALWLGVHRRDLAEATSESQQWIFDQGSEVGRLAQKLFPCGIEVAEDYLHPAEALEATARACAEGATVLYEPAFAFDGAFARVDILVAVGDGTWDLYEVKSTSAVKDVHVTDAAVQAYAVEGSGLPLHSINIVHLNTAYVYTGGEYDVRALFTVEDVTDRARAFMPSIPATLARLRATLEGPEPEVRIGSQCSTPYSCEFAPYCHAFLPADHPVTALPRLHEAQLHALLDAGITCIRSIPDDFSDLTATQRECVAVVKAGEPQIDAVGLAAALGGLVWPVYHLDFETIAPALPLWPGTRPYQAIPFQYSIHVHGADGAVEHRQYLHAAGGDPRRPLAERMIADLGQAGSILHYTPYERTQIDGLAAAFPDLVPALEAIRARLFDLEPVIRTHARHPESAGRSSIKCVLPAWCPELSYAELNIGDGQVASARYLRVCKGLASTEEAEAVLADLVEYCAMDTYAMVRLLEEMLARAPQVGPAALDCAGNGAGTDTVGVDSPAV